MSRLAVAALLAAAIVAATVRPVAADPPSLGCAVPTDLARLRGQLPRTAMRIARHETLTVVAIGSSSTEGIGASNPAASYPARLAAALAGRLKWQEVTVLNKGVGGETAPQMLARFDRDVFAERPDLVIWQVGTNTVLEDGNVTAIGDVMREGIARLKEAGIDLVIMNPQYSPAVLRHPLYRDMLHVLANTAAENRVPLFSRFALMRHWVQSGQFDFATMVAPDGLHQNDRSYRCVGRALADAIVDTALLSTMTSRR
jgi:lysophospholipase L1-like esterase